MPHLPAIGGPRAFAFDEPNYQAGVYRDVLLRPWRNTLGRTMWNFPAGRTGGNRYLVLGPGARQAADLATSITPTHRLARARHAADHYAVRHPGGVSEYIENVLARAGIDVEALLERRGSANTPAAVVGV